MIYLYDKALADDIQSAIDPSHSTSSVVKVISPDEILGVVAQLQDDQIKLPMICLIRESNIPIDENRTNFTRMHTGVPAAYNSEKNTLYLERAIPIELKYTVNILATNTADSDELLREMLFRYIKNYFITIKLPYEASREIKFGVRIDNGSISKNSASLEYIQTGVLHQTSFDIICEGAVMITYTSKHAERLAYGGQVIEP